MKIEFTDHAWEDFGYWSDNDPDIILRNKRLLLSIQESPFKGLGKPEPLKHNLKGFWSRRITGEHRLVYKVSGKKGVDLKCSIVSCRFHYD